MLLLAAVDARGLCASRVEREGFAIKEEVRERGRVSEFGRAVASCGNSSFRMRVLRRGPMRRRWGGCPSERDGEGGLTYELFKLCYVSGYKTRSGHYVAYTHDLKLKGCKFAIAR